MPKTRLAAAASCAVALALGGCGSNGKTTSTAGSAASGAPSTSSSSTSSAGGQSGSPSTSSPAPAATAVITTKRAAKLGTVLAFGPKKLTVYLFEADKSGASACTGACAKTWPPVTGKPKAAGGALSHDLGTITRPDGSKQVTYKGHLLYLFMKDKDAGDAYGQGLKSFGAEWYALSPSGRKVDLS